MNPISTLLYEIGGDSQHKPTQDRLQGERDFSEHLSKEHARRPLKGESSVRLGDRNASMDTEKAQLLTSTEHALATKETIPTCVQSLTDWQASRTRVYPQSLRVIGYLSMLGKHGTVDLGTQPDLLGANCQQKTTSSRNALSLNPPGSFEERSELSAASSQLPKEYSASAYADVLVQADASSEPSRALMGVHDWAKRQLRVTYRGQSATVWIRDYALDKKQERDVVEQVRLHADAEGKTLERIFINGREAWLAAHGHATATAEQIHGS